MAEAAVGQIPQEHVEEIDILLRVDSAGATHELLRWCREGRSVGFDLTEPVRAAILALGEGSWGGCPKPRRTLSGGPPAPSAAVGSVLGA